MQSPESVDALSIIGFFLTLVGLLGSFFYIHLSDWYREVLALEVKWEIYRVGDLPEEKQARKECRYEIIKIGNWTVLSTSIVVTIFILFMAILSGIIWVTEPNKTGVWNYIGIAGLAFLVIYLGMTTLFLVSGYRKTSALQHQIFETSFPGQSSSRKNVSSRRKKARNND